MKINKILITGGAGFLGSNLANKLYNNHTSLTLLDNLQTGNLENINALLNSNNVTFIKGDVKNPLPDEYFDEIWNLACAASPPAYQKDPIDTLMTNVLGMKNVLELAKKHGSKVFQASTSVIYGDPLVHPQPESYNGNVNATGPRACYDEGKRAAETLCYDYNRLFGVDVRVARIFNTYGPNMDALDGRVVTNFILNAMNDKPLELYGDGEQTRSFCYVDDLLDGFIGLMSLETMPSQPVNIGNPNEFTVRDLGEVVLKLTGSNAGFIHKSLPQDDPKVRQPDISKAKELFGFSPKIQLEEGVLKTITYFQNQNKKTAKAA